MRGRKEKERCHREREREAPRRKRQPLTSYQLPAAASLIVSRYSALLAHCTILFRHQRVGRGGDTPPLHPVGATRRNHFQFQSRTLGESCCFWTWTLIILISLSICVVCPPLMTLPAGHASAVLNGEWLSFRVFSKRQTCTSE